jgi:glycine cleavage system T protein
MEVVMAEDKEQATPKSPLQDRQRDLGAQFSLFHGWEMAASYSNVIDEHLAVREGVGLIDRSYIGCIKVWGGEAVQFLNGLVSNDVKTLAEGKGMRAAFLTGHGKVRALCRILNLGHEFLVINDPQTHAKVFSYVSPFSYAGDFKVEDVSEQYRLLSVQGPKAHLIMKEICFEPVPPLDEHGWFPTLIAGHRALAVSGSPTGEQGFDIMVPESALIDVWDFILLRGRFHSVVPVGLQAWDSLRIEAALPVYGADVDETNMLLETGLDDAVSFTKGCYTGQEAVAMATYRGHISKKLSGLSITSKVVPNQGDKVKMDGKEIGFVTSALQSPTLGSVIALAYLKYGFFVSGNNVEIESSSMMIPATVVELPFINRT